MIGGDNGAGLRARVLRPVKGCRDGEVHPVQLREGDEVTGDLARELIRAGYAKQIGAKIENKASGVAKTDDRFRGAADVEGANGSSGRKRAKPVRRGSAKGAR